MNYWITTHWPPHTDFIGDLYCGIWLQDGLQDVAATMAPGDLAFKFESRAGKSRQRIGPTGVIVIPCRPGREGIVALMEVTSQIYPLSDSSPEQYVGGEKKWWRYHADAIAVNSAGFLSRPETNRILGYKEDNRLRGFGDRHSGLKRIDKATFDALLDKFVSSTLAYEQQQRSARWHVAAPGGNGEGPIHLALKDRIADNPSAALGEEGLILWKKEWLLPSSDKVDLVLKDRYGRFVAVEVEVDCASNEIVGPLQCMKYRAMASYLLGRKYEETRAMLVAHSIASDVSDRCRCNGIEPKVVSRG